MGSLSTGEGWRSGYHPSDNNSNPLFNEMFNLRSVLRTEGQEKAWSSCQDVLCPSPVRNMLPKEGMDAASLKVFKDRLHGVLGNMNWWVATRQAGSWNFVGFEVPSNLSHSMILWITTIKLQFWRSHIHFHVGWVQSTTWASPMCEPWSMWNTTGFIQFAIGLILNW